MDDTQKHTITHFSHQHPLETTVSLPTTTGNTTCSGCNLKISSRKHYYYDCKTCSFSLHKTCSNMPRKTTHPAHPNHPLTLSSLPPPNSAKCKACSRNILSGFYYNCSQCDIFYHILCSSLPLSLPITSHPHALRIEFSSPYDFSCDLCEKPSFTHFGWLYRCRFCEFDAHISCAFAQMEANRMIIDYGIDDENDEFVQLVQQGVVDFELCDESELRVAVNTNRDEDLQMTPSYNQCSSCFSIELLKSYECCHDHISSSPGFREEGRRSEFSSEKINDEKMIMKLEEVDYGNRAVVNPSRTTAKSDKGNLRQWSSRWKLLGCFYTTKYQKCSKSSFNNH